MQETCELKCDWATYEAAKYACLHWHYSKAIPAGKMLKIGAWEDGKYIGVVLFSLGANKSIGTPYGLKDTECCELTRIALTDHKHFVSEIMMQAVKKLKELCPGIRLVVSFADPEHGHVGAIYQATNWIYTGMSAAADEYVINGKRIHGRQLRSLKESNPIYKHRTSKEFATYLDKNFKSIKGSSKYRYLMPLDKKMRKLILPLAKPYPKKEDGG